MERHEILAALNRVAGDERALYAMLRTLPVDMVGEFLLHVPPEYSVLAAALPSMAAEEIQVNWTGSAGYTLLTQSCSLARAIETGHLRHTGRTLEDARILDFGCGWGRIIRLMYSYTSPENIYGCDPWDRSIQICKDSRLRAHLALSDYLPTSLPFPGVKFDLIYAVSVFTHLSERATLQALEALRGSLSPSGLLVLTVRPSTYWDYHQQQLGEVDREYMKKQHAESGFAFNPHLRDAVDGDVTYGDTSISLDYVARKWTKWQLVGTDMLLQDPFQRLLFLKPKS